MNRLSGNCPLDAEDRRVYSTWLQVVVATCGAVIFCRVAAVAFPATANVPNIAEFLTGAVALASP